MKIIKTLFVVTFALVAAYSVYSTQQNAGMSDLALANADALANGEATGKHAEKATKNWQEGPYYGTSDNGELYEFYIVHEETNCYGSGVIDCEWSYKFKIVKTE